MIVKLLTEHHLELQSLKGGCRGSSESTHVKMPHCWKSHALAQMILRLTLKCTLCQYAFYHVVKTDYKYIQEVILLHHLRGQVFITEELYTDVDHSVSYCGSI